MIIKMTDTAGRYAPGLLVLYGLKNKMKSKVKSIHSITDHFRKEIIWRITYQKDYKELPILPNGLTGQNANCLPIVTKRSGS